MTEYDALVARLTQYAEDAEHFAADMASRVGYDEDGSVIAEPRQRAKDWRAAATALTALAAKVALYRRQLAAMERARPLCPNCRDKQRGSECLACERDALAAERDAALSATYQGRKEAEQWREAAWHHGHRPFGLTLLRYKRTNPLPWESRP